MKIALDTGGGDESAEERVKGAADAVRGDDSLSVILVGDEYKIEKILSRLEPRPSRLDVYHAPDVVGMDEKGAESIRNKPEASINGCVDLVEEGRADGLVSAGNTGATVSATTVEIGLLEGVRRPGITVPIPTEERDILLIDAGANIYCKPEHLLQYGLMASEFYKSLRDREEPRVSLLNIGAEKTKGTQLVRETYPLLEESDQLLFAGNVEGQDLFRGDVDIVVSDGFTGNILLKSLEGWSRTLLDYLSERVDEHLDKAGAESFRSSVLNELREKIDYVEPGGAVLLGARTTCIICHGRSDRRAIQNAIHTATRHYRKDINERIVQILAEQIDPVQGKE